MRSKPGKFLGDGRGGKTADINNIKNGSCWPNIFSHEGLETGFPQTGYNLAGIFLGRIRHHLHGKSTRRRNGDWRNRSGRFNVGRLQGYGARLSVRFSGLDPPQELSIHHPSHELWGAGSGNF